MCFAVWLRALCLQVLLHGYHKSSALLRWHRDHKNKTPCFKRVSNRKGMENETYQTKIKNTCICHFQLFPWHPVVWADPPSKNYSSSQPDKEITTEANHLNSLKHRPNTFSVPLLHLINSAGRKFSGGEEHVQGGQALRRPRWQGQFSRTSECWQHAVSPALACLFSSCCWGKSDTHSNYLLCTMVLFREAMPYQQIPPI